MLQRKIEVAWEVLKNRNKKDEKSYKSCKSFESVKRKSKRNYYSSKILENMGHYEWTNR